MTLQPEIDSNAVHEVRLLPLVAERALNELGSAERRSMAVDAAIVIADLHARLGGGDRFPIRSAATLLATLDPNVALAAAITPTLASSLLPLMERVDDELIELLISSATKFKGSVANRYCEVLARYELLEFNRGTRKDISKKLSHLAKKSGRWAFALQATEQLISREATSTAPASDSGTKVLEDHDSRVRKAVKRVRRPPGNGEAMLSKWFARAMEAAGKAGHSWEGCLVAEILAPQVLPRDRTTFS